MATGKITKEAVEAVPLPDLGKREHLWDETLKGFGVMVTDKGVRSYIVQYRVGGRGHPTRRVTIGKHGSPWTAKTARDRAAELLEQVRRKVDPFDAAKDMLAESRQRKAAEAAQQAIVQRLAFDVMADDYIKKRAKGKIRTWKEYESILKRDLKPVLGSRPLPDISSADISELLEKVGERGNTAALRAYNVLRAVFSFAVDTQKRHYKAAMSPMLDVARPGVIVKRERYLSDDELRYVWQAAGGLGWPFCPLVRLLILTGQRLREVAHMTWDELDLDARIWIIPGARAKNGQTSLVPLSEGAHAILSDLPKIKNDENLLFPSSAKTALTAFSKPKAKLDSIMLDLLRKAAIEAERDPDEVKLANWRLHDLRRTLAVGCQKMGIPAEVTEEVLNHKSGTRDGIVGVYQVYRFQKEKTAALAAWDARIAGIVTGQPPATNVVALVDRRN